MSYKDAALDLLEHRIGNHRLKVTTLILQTFRCEEDSLSGLSTLFDITIELRLCKVEFHIFQLQSSHCQLPDWQRRSSMVTPKSVERP